MKQLTENQLNALNEFASKNGKQWKQALLNAWMSGNYGYGLSVDCSAYLQQVRNQFGPSWLTKFK